MNFYKKLCAIVLALTTIVAQAVVPTIKSGVLTIGLDGTQAGDWLSFTEEPNGTVTASGLDIQYYCYIARRIGLRPVFIQYADSAAAEAALAANEVDVIGGWDFQLSGGGDITFYGVAQYVYTEVTGGEGTFTTDQAWGLGLMATDGDLANFPCELAFAIQAAVDAAIASGMVACYLSRNNGAGDLIGLDASSLPPYPFYSVVNGFIPSSTDEVPACVACPPVTLPVESCLVTYLQSLPTNCSSVVVSVV